MEQASALTLIPEASADSAVYDAIYGAVVEHRLVPGTRLTEASLCKLFDVSRRVVGIALLRLSHDRIVTLTPNRGATIARPTVAETRAVFEMRRLVECAAMELICVRALARDLENLRLLVRQEHSAFDHGQLRQWIRLSGEFHLRLIDIAGNAVLSETARDLITRSLLMTALYMQPGQPSCASHEHEELIDALEAGQGKRAARMMGAHLLACEARLHLDEPAAASFDLATALGRGPAVEKPRRTLPNKAIIA